MNLTKVRDAKPEVLASSATFFRHEGPKITGLPFASKIRPHVRSKGNIMLSYARIIIALLLVAISVTAVAKPMEAPGLDFPVKVIRDIDGIPHIIGKSEHDVIFVQGYLHAQDRFFQMDASRRQGSGTLAELLGAPALASDVQLRTFGRYTVAPWSKFLRRMRMA